MSIVVRIERQACPRCRLPLKVVRERDGTTVRYDVAGWSRQCQRADCDGPLACPWMKPALKAWLDET